MLVLYASEHGATREIAEHIAGRLRHHHLNARAQSLTVTSAVDLLSQDAFVIGSAVYYGSWMRSAVLFVERHQETLAQRPVWLFSSGPLGTDEVDRAGHDVRKAAEPRQLRRLTTLLAPRDHHVFFGSLNPETLGLAARAVRALPAGRELLPVGDFRNVAEMDSWADQIAQELGQADTAEVAEVSAVIQE
jgi:menaquinone-dependent protoporphyrinogen oxidase